MIKSINITKQDYLDYSQFAAKRLCKPKNKKGSAFLKNMILWFVLTVAFMIIFQIKSINLSNFHLQSSLVTGLPFVIFICAFFFNIRKIRKSSIPNENGLMIGKKTIEFQVEGINEAHPFGNCFYKWEAVEALEENKGNVYIFVDKLLALIIPSKSFSNAEEREELIEFVKKHV